MTSKLFVFLLVLFFVPMMTYKSFQDFLLGLFENRANSLVGSCDILKNRIHFVKNDNIAQNDACDMFFGHRVHDNAKSDISDDDIDFTQDSCNADIAYESSELDGGDDTCNPVCHCKVDVEYQDVCWYRLVDGFAQNVNQKLRTDKAFKHHKKTIEVIL